MVPGDYLSYTGSKELWMHNAIEYIGTYMCSSQTFDDNTYVMYVSLMAPLCRNITITMSAAISTSIQKQT